MSSRPRTGREIREAFLRFFEERGHRVISSASLVPESDPTLLFTNAGMVPFKRVFTGEEVRDYRRAVSAQKCMRVSGKHNDLENVGRTPRHHTFFEMLGNFSFGDYFKREAIVWAWELVTAVYGIPREKLGVTVFREDDEAERIWREEVGIAADRVVRLDEADNFWSMGDTGPCGPCSEIYFDLGSQPGSKPGFDPTDESGRWLEIWNLVFMQFERDATGTLTPLPKPCVDTGAGLERLAAVLQGKGWTYDTDLFQSILARVQELSGSRYGADPEKDVSLRVVADHARAVSFLIADGVLPSNEGRGYVLRRILRRAARHGVLLGLERPFLFRVCGVVIEHMSSAYPELSERAAYVADRVQREEERFLTTLSKGLALLEEEVHKLKAEGGSVLPGEIVFKLYDTYGFPVDLTADILLGEKLAVDQPGFDRAMEVQRERARAAWKGSGAVQTGAGYSALTALGGSEFRGYDSLRLSSRVMALLVDGRSVPSAGEGQAVEVVVEETPFYAESGGQIGDSGRIVTPSGEVEVGDTQRPTEGVIVHRGHVVRGEIHVDERAELSVAFEARAGAVRHHSGTHLLHAALREVLGPQATQRGSLVAPGRLRFDFSHDAPLSQRELERIETLVNAWVVENAPAGVEYLSYKEALAAGALAMFGENYGDNVRVVSFGDFSKELCGGTHARATGDIGPFKIIGESGVAAGVRRVEALAGAEALAHWRGQERALERTAELLRAPVSEVVQRVEKLLEERRVLERELAALRAEKRGAASGDLVSQAREIAGTRVLTARVDGVSGAELRELVDTLRGKLKSGVVLVAVEEDGRVSLALGVTPDLSPRFKAGELIREIAAVVGGKGGGRPDFAQAGGGDPSRLDAAFAALEKLIARS